MTEREELATEVSIKLGIGDNNLLGMKIADFILADRRRVVKPLVKRMKINRFDNELTWDAIDQTLANAGITNKD